MERRRHDLVISGDIVERGLRVNIDGDIYRSAVSVKGVWYRSDDVVTVAIT